MLWISKVWAWLKQYWKWIIFPVGLLGMVAAFIAGRIGRDTDPGLPPPDLGKAGEDALDKVEEADKNRDEQLRLLNAAHHDKLQSLTDDQRKEHDELKKKSIEEVTSWFDGLR